MWKTRIGKNPSPNFWADFVALTNQLYPGAALDQDSLNELYNLVVEQWRNGVQIHLIASQLCSCDGKKIVPSEAARTKLQKQRGLARGPLDAEPGQIFGTDDLREPAAIERVKVKIAQLAVKIRRGGEGIGLLREKSQRAKEGKKEELEQLISDAEGAIKRLLIERQELVAALEAQTAGSRWAPKKEVEAIVPYQTKTLPAKSWEILLGLIEEGRPILIAQEGYGLPTINDVADAVFMGYGSFKGETSQGEFTFRGGGEMSRLDGISYTVVQGDYEHIRFKDGGVGYDFAGVKARLIELTQGESAKPPKSAKAPKLAKPPKPAKLPKPAKPPKPAKLPKNSVVPAPPLDEARSDVIPTDLEDEFLNDIARRS